jgi:hypothetical protein
VSTVSSIDQADYALLNAVDLEEWQVYLLAAPNMHDIMNSPEHGLDAAALFERFLRLWRTGLIECSLEDPFRPIEPDPDLLHEQFDAMPEDSPAEDRILLYRLTGAGGRVWEELSAPDWNQLIRRRTGAITAAGQEWVISGADRALVEQAWKYHHAWGEWPHPVDGTVHYDVLEPYHPTYWKTLPAGYAYGFDVQDDWKKQPLSDPALVTKWLQESMALRDIEAGWRRDFGEVCGRLAG